MSGFILPDGSETTIRAPIPEDDTMANVKKGTTVPPPQWWKHLRSWKRIFWKKQRKAHNKELKNAIKEK
jgi:hypothetical protein